MKKFEYKNGGVKERKRFNDVFFDLRKRCNCENSTGYKHYGGRGIKCLWKSVEEFREDMFDSYVEAFIKNGKRTQIDRIDNNGNYCKENCRWVTAKENSMNRRTNIKPEDRKVSFGESPGYWKTLLGTSRY